MPPRGINVHPRGINMHPRGMNMPPRGMNMHPRGTCGKTSSQSAKSELDYSLRCCFARPMLAYKQCVCYDVDSNANIVFLASG